MNNDFDKLTSVQKKKFVLACSSGSFPNLQARVLEYVGVKIELNSFLHLHARKIKRLKQERDRRNKKPYSPNLKQRLNEIKYKRALAEITSDFQEFLVNIALRKIGKKVYTKVLYRVVKNWFSANRVAIYGIISHVPNFTYEAIAEKSIVVVYNGLDLTFRKKTC